jgi:hypothetical protein
VDKAVDSVVEMCTSPGITDRPVEKPVDNPVEKVWICGKTCGYRRVVTFGAINAANFVAQ